MKFVLLFGPQAVGKMTVGQELEKITELKLFHNHMTIELVHHFFDFETQQFQRLVDLFRHELFSEAAKSGLGMIFTYVWAFDQQDDWDFIETVCQTFESQGGEVYFVELTADLEERIMRNKTPNRLEHKPTKRNIEKSEHNLRKTLEKHRLNSFAGEITRKNYIKINNTNLDSTETARLIKEKLQL
ncbi:AAA family ATPase [Sediminibacillus albus]|uniref:AAA domain-containing protein n=1 Tax=Sediminibacillus albus TaxID=407036 RepID=A0A1G8YNY1_9BACI|nr:AAA family ATPase [Sediminibacillus albus]SDK04549.1 AAA domain-containing protein [Sediminibacillus albus]